MITDKTRQIKSITPVPSSPPRLCVRNFFLFLIFVTGSLFAQEKSMEQFSLRDVTLLDGPFKNAMDLNTRVLLQYDVDRLTAPFLKEAGLPAKGPLFPNWAGLDGHIGGHYLSALAITWAATGDPAVKERLEYMLSEMKKAQVKNGNGYVGGVPNGQALWDEIKRGNINFIRGYWVPWYNMHKVYAGLRDTWVYAGSAQAKDMFLSLCDWGLTVIAPLTDRQMEAMLSYEFGGMNEVYADAYKISGNAKYMDAAKRFAHKEIFGSMAAGFDNLDDKHANTQVQKAVGYGRVAELGRDPEYIRAAAFFWDTVVNKRSLAFGGNSRREHFPRASDTRSYIEDREGPESCNTYNMLKLTETLFRMEQKPEYADFYERAMFNHILSTQHPVHGGYVYFTPVRPMHYRVYSAPNSAMWCCVGTGMENHGKYGSFIYTHSDNALYVNLFVASQLNWKEKNVRVTQDTRFPDGESSRLTVSADKPVRFSLAVRHPRWAIGMKASVNGEDISHNTQPSSYIVIDRVWNNGDVVDLSMPMGFTLEELPHYTNYIAIMRGPVLMGARTGTDNLTGLIAGDDRWAHIASGPFEYSFEAPFILGDRKAIAARLSEMQPVAGKPMCYTNPALFTREQDKRLVLEPFFRIHDSRYMAYWLSMPNNEYAAYSRRVRSQEKAKVALDLRTIDSVAVGEQQPEKDHMMNSSNSRNGIHSGEQWRDAINGGFFEYNLLTGGNVKGVSLMLRYWGNESGNRIFDILIDGKVLCRERLEGKWRRDEFIDVKYRIPAAMLQGKDSVTVRIQSLPDSIAGGIFYMRLLK